MNELWLRLDEAIEKNDLGRASELLAAARVFSDRRAEPRASLEFDSFRDRLPIREPRRAPWLGLAALAAAAAAAVPLFLTAMPERSEHGTKGAEGCGAVRLRLAEWREGEIAHLDSLVVSPGATLAARAQLAAPCWITLIEASPGAERIVSPPTWREAGQVDLFTAAGEGVFALDSSGRHTLVLLAMPEQPELSIEELIDLAHGEPHGDVSTPSIDLIVMEAR